MNAATLAFIVREMQDQLDVAGVDNPLLDARLLVAHALGIDRTEIAARGERILESEEVSCIRRSIARRCRREPVARILGSREFWSLPFGLNEATLDPRPDSETLVEVALKELQGRSTVSILDAGTGTGCLLLALLHELPDATGVGIDIAQRAIEQARANAESLNLQTRATFRMSNWLDNITEQHFDAIVSNPPYIASKDIPTLMPEVRNYDPTNALDGGPDGYAAYRTLIPQFRERLKPGGFAAVECGAGQAANIAAIFKQYGFMQTTTHLDLGGIERCVKAFAG